MQGSLRQATNMKGKPHLEVVRSGLERMGRRSENGESFRQRPEVFRKKEAAETDTNVGIGDMRVSDDPGVNIITYALGSCIGVAVYDPVAKVGGLLHIQLPSSAVDPSKAKKRPLMFADTGIPMLFKACYKLGARKGRMIVKIAGGSQLMDARGVFNIGKRNYAALRKIFWRNNVLIDAEDVGGTVNRTLRLSIATGEVSLRVSGHEFKAL